MPSQTRNTDSYSLMLHGGAGAMRDIRDEQSAAPYLASITTALEHGRALLAAGGSALDAVEACARLLEDDPLFNAGRGSVLNADGRVEMDAAIMDGRDLSAGAVAAVTGVANPVSLARRVMTGSGHVMLAAEGALRFAEECGMEIVTDDYFLTPQRIEELRKARRQSRAMPDPLDSEDNQTGTIGAVARDCYGNLAAATSTGGMVNKRQGRVGDSPIVGAGVYADNASCAVSATGVGEELLRTVIAKTIADFIDLKGMDAAQATAAGMDYLARKVNGRGGVIVIDSAGRCASGFTTRKMIHGWIEQGGKTICRI